ncbi:LacI family DNA-binding transcriptional regulator [Candidatus Stoquefichus sp. SB1]|jgi:LacI family transcriptional regulator|uniref:LacI family DNA-binding transcriptional regulator n=1 Tax=Candidatus Stoquefichus sp. SB1 TaxID=1658109 RepID=UPI00067E8B2D|nr:LacI family DNA-binding transcriptional regulator [Candidatus Stoquefichus sp. SB1]
MAKKQVTIKEIAKQSGVSVSTVSRVLNDSPSVAPEKRKRIQEVIDQLGFQPSMLARGMVSKETYTFAVIVPDITNPYFTSLIFEIEQYSKKRGYSLLLVNTMTAGKNKDENSSTYEINNFKTIKEKQVDGVIILGGEIDKVDVDPHYIKALNDLHKQIPVIIIGQKHVGCQCIFIERNHEKGVIALTQHLLALGHRDIAFIGGEPGVIITEERLRAFKNTLSIYSRIKDEYIILTDYYTKDGYNAMRQLIGADTPLPSAIVAINDNVAMGAIRALTDAGLNCPIDVKIVSCDYFSNSEYNVPRLTTIDQHNEYLGQFAVSKLINIIHSQDNDSQFFHEPELIIRESCGTYLKEDQS